ncbi:TAXI family TRAP transporter solute-binding subunit [Pelagibacterium limicola]|uniref:TAXI family TRAP transporter solute-binding subunit n=1 Tax=Pelagibacterium limicola TaxID=2791022 RepID=UPI0018AF75B8|nr:TAXI family TRAP transporter solute-binding subunit [Pelagibacterium limicola]
MKLLPACAVAGALALTAPAFGQMQLSIATGGTGGAYYPIGGGLAELIGQHIDGYAAVAEVTGASVENMALIHNGGADFAIALGDTVYQAYTGTGAFEVGKVDALALAALYPNAVQIVVPAESDIQSLSDLRGKRVSVGAPGSGTEINAQAILHGNGMSYEDLASAQRLNFNETADAIRDGDIDAGIWSVGPPTGSIISLAATRSIRLIPLTTEEIANAKELEPIFADYTLPEGIYDGTAQTATVGIPNALVVPGDMDDDLAYQVTKLLFEEVEYLRSIHPATNDTTIEFSLGASPIPLHPGAIRYYEEVGATVPDRLRP